MLSGALRRWSSICGGRGAGAVAGIWLAAGAALVPASPAMAGDDADGDPYGLRTFLTQDAAVRSVHWSFMAEFWATTVDGDFNLDGTSTDIDVSIWDGDDDLDDDDDDDDDDDEAAGLHLRAEGVVNRFVFFLDVSGAGAQDENRALGAAVGDLEVALGWFEFGVGFRLVDVAGADWGPPRVSLDALVGGRVTRMDAELEVPGADIDGEHTWIEPYVGGQLGWRPIPQMKLRLAGDVGGFGAGSEFSWQAAATLGYTFHIGRMGLTVHGGYRVLAQDFDEEADDDLSGWDGSVHGPVAGVTLEF